MDVKDRKYLLDETVKLRDAFSSRALARRRIYLELTFNEFGMMYGPNQLTRRICSLGISGR
jgi:hypothetical protein